MKKLTKRVQAGGLWFDVPSNTQWVTINSDGELFSSEQRKKPVAGISNWMFSNSFRKNLFSVELCGKDWLECCWYVGYQSDSKDAERREWMARGAELLSSEVKSLGLHAMDVWFAENFAAKIRSGEVE